MNKILVIEDEAPLREEIVQALIFEGYTVLEAQNGVEGARLAQQEQPDLIICDVMMPHLDGWGVLSRLRSEPSDPLHLSDGEG